MAKMKTKSITMRYDESLADIVAVLKHRPGGVTKVFEAALRRVKITDEELAAVKLFQSK